MRLPVVLLAVVAIAAAVLAPAYARAAQQSVLSDGLAASPDPGLSFSGESTIGEARQAVAGALVGTPVLGGVLAPPVGGVDADTVVSGGGEPVSARLAYRDGVCGQLAIAGDCPGGPGEVLVSDRTAQAYRIAIGDRLSAGTVVGTYAPVDPTGPYWGRTVYFVQGGFDPASGLPRADAVFTGGESDVYAEPGATVTLTYPLRGLRLDDVPAVRDELPALAAVGGLALTTDLPAILDGIADDQAAIGRAAPVIAVPLFVLAGFVLFLLVAALTEQRGPELGLAKLRGFPAGRVARFGVGPVLMLVAAAAPVGVALGLGVVWLVFRDVELRWPVVAAAAGALVLTGLASMVAARSTLRRDTLDLLRQVRRGRSRAGLVEGAVVALAAASLVVALGDPAAPLALLAPASVAVVAGIVTARLVRLWAARRRYDAIPALLAAARLARRPDGGRVIVVATVAVALLSFGVSAWVVAAQARHDHAVDTLGAERVYTVHADHPAALVEAVRAADPAGGSMAVVRATGQYAGSPVELVAVDAPRLAEVVRWRGQDALASLVAALRPREPAPLPVAGRLEVELAVRELGPEPVRLSALVSAPGEPPRSVSLGTLDRDTRRYAATVPGCDRPGCRLLGFGLGRTGVVGPFTATVQIGSIRSGDGELAARLDDPASWRATPAASLTPGSALTVAAAGTDDVVVEYHDTPAAVPVVLAGDAPADDPAAVEFTFPGFTDQPEPFTVVRSSERLPRAGDRGLLFDLESAVSRAERTVALSDLALRYEVWASPTAPADLPQRLAGQGAPVLRTESMSGELAQLGRRAPALGWWLCLLAAAAAVALAIGVVALYARSGSLRIPEVPARLLRHAVVREYALLLGWPLLVGAVVGVAAAALMLPGLPLVEVDVR
jgi:putative ABC transport system permease protein